ncbi:hypothetical protein BZA05DRAFT_445007 [Tricharina praecox]|uniref:uncharacterized protein n=1 Tax=Tricharina praecox TaxID=43433 RepID=UPI00221F2753|nr:uncharacterized protein BZA05DRAFT_445007 [Tricharina praecox]KAI5851840.1 hypothetical protein BZA05DRAFT_445007 [Tricharina praecox]
MPTLITIPPELVRQIADHLTSDDLINLRLASLAFYDYFTGSDTLEWAHKLFFPTSYEKLRKEFTKQKLEYDPTSFDKEYVRSRRWKTNSPTSIHHYDITKDARFIIDQSEDVMVYERARGQIIIQDIGKGFDTSMEHVLSMNYLRCMLLPRLDFGERLMLHANGGVLLVVGYAHTHQNVDFITVTEEHPPEPAHPGILEQIGQLLHLVDRGQPIAPVTTTREVLVTTNLPPHTQCAVFSLKHRNRGQLLASWHELDGFNDKAAVNEFYVISQFHPTEHRLHGYIFPRDGVTEHRFAMRETGFRQMGVALAADTQGKVFYVAYMCPALTRFPVVEIHATPSPISASAWGQPSLLKRVVVRCLGLPLPPPITPDFDVHSFLKENHLTFDEATTAGLEGCDARGKKGRRGVGEEMIRLRLVGRTGDTSDAGFDYEMVSWDISARPSPLRPSSGELFSQGVHWQTDQTVPEDTSPYVNVCGVVDLDDVYPKPAYLRYPGEGSVVMRSASTMDVDRFEGRRDLVRCLPVCSVSGVEGGDGDHFAVFYTDQPEMLVQPSPNSLDRGSLVLGTTVAVHPYPDVPGIDDEDFVPLGEYFSTPTVEMPFRAGTTQHGLRIPAPLFGSGTIGVDLEQKRYAVYYTAAVGGRQGERKIVMLRYR